MRHTVFLMVLLIAYRSGNIWQELVLELEPESKLWTKVDPESEPKINNFGSATLTSPKKKPIN